MIEAACETCGGTGLLYPCPSPNPLNIVEVPCHACRVVIEKRLLVAADALAQMVYEDCADESSPLQAAATVYLAVRGRET